MTKRLFKCIEYAEEVLEKASSYKYLKRIPVTGKNGKIRYRYIYPKKRFKRSKKKNFINQSIRFSKLDKEFMQRSVLGALQKGKNLSVSVFRYQFGGSPQGWSGVLRSLVNRGIVVKQGATYVLAKDSGKEYTGKVDTVTKDPKIKKLEDRFNNRNHAWMKSLPSFDNLKDAEEVAKYFKKNGKEILSEIGEIVGFPKPVKINLDSSGNTFQWQFICAEGMNLSSELTYAPHQNKITLYVDSVYLPEKYRKKNYVVQYNMILDDLLKEIKSKVTEGYDQKTALLADIDVGKYYWAKQGFCYSDHDQRDRHADSVYESIDKAKYQDGKNNTENKRNLSTLFDESGNVTTFEDSGVSKDSLDAYVKEIKERVKSEDLQPIDLILLEPKLREGKKLYVQSKAPFTGAEYTYTPTLKDYGFKEDTTPQEFENMGYSRDYKEKLVEEKETLKVTKLEGSKVYFVKSGKNLSDFQKNEQSLNVDAFTSEVKNWESQQRIPVTLGKWVLLNSDRWNGEKNANPKTGKEKEVLEFGDRANMKSFLKSGGNWPWVTDTKKDSVSKSLGSFKYFISK